MTQSNLSDLDKASAHFITAIVSGAVRLMDFSPSSRNVRDLAREAEAIFSDPAEGDAFYSAAIALVQSVTWGENIDARGVSLSICASVRKRNETYGRMSRAIQVHQAGIQLATWRLLATERHVAHSHGIAEHFASFSEDEQAAISAAAERIAALGRSLRDAIETARLNKAAADRAAVFEQELLEIRRVRAAKARRDQRKAEKAAVVQDSLASPAGDDLPLFSGLAA